MYQNLEAALRPLGGLPARETATHSDSGSDKEDSPVSPPRKRQYKKSRTEVQNFHFGEAPDKTFQNDEELQAWLKTVGDKEFGIGHKWLVGTRWKKSGDNDACRFQCAYKSCLHHTGGCSGKINLRLPFPDPQCPRLPILGATRPQA